MIENCNKNDKLLRSLRIEIVHRISLCIQRDREIYNFNKLSKWHHVFRLDLNYGRTSATFYYESSRSMNRIKRPNRDDLP